MAYSSAPSVQPQRQHKAQLHSGAHGKVQRRVRRGGGDPSVSPAHCNYRGPPLPCMPTRPPARMPACLPARPNACPPAVMALLLPGDVDKSSAAAAVRAQARKDIWMDAPEATGIWMDATGPWRKGAW